MSIVDVIQQLVLNKGRVDFLTDPCFVCYSQAEQIELEIEGRTEANAVSVAQVCPYLVPLFCQELQDVDFLNEDSLTKIRTQIEQWRIASNDDSKNKAIKEALLLALHHVYIEQQQLSKKPIASLILFNRSDRFEYYQAWRMFKETLASANTDPTVRLHAKNLLAQIAESKELAQISFTALTAVLSVINDEVNKTLKTQDFSALTAAPTIYQNIEFPAKAEIHVHSEIHGPRGRRRGDSVVGTAVKADFSHAIECMHYYQNRLALEDTLAKQQKNQAIRVSGKSILEQIVRLKGSPSFPLAELSTTLLNINATINDQNKNNIEVASLIQYSHARLALQNTLSKQRVNPSIKKVGEEILKHMTQLATSFSLSLDELTESLEAFNEIITIQLGTCDETIDSLHYEQARLTLRATLTNRKTIPILRRDGENILAHTDQLKKLANRTTSLCKLTSFLELNNQVTNVPTVLNAQACRRHYFKTIAPRSNRKLHAALLGLMGAVILVASVVIALGSFGIVSPLSVLVILMGISLIAQATSIGAGVIGASMVGRSLFSLFKPKSPSELLEGDLVNLSTDVQRLAS